MRAFLLVILVALLPTAAQAKWMEASSRHFVIYSDDQSQNIQRLSEQLERFHVAMIALIGVQDVVPSPSNRVTVYMVRSDSQVRKLAGDTSQFVYAFYVPRAGGSLAIVPHVRSGSGDLDFSMIALLHEYAHHVTFATSSVALPVWVVEGSAEFFASARFESDGSVFLGLPANHRAGELLYARDVPLKELLEPDLARRAKQRNYDSFYGKSWLFFHYLTFSKERTGQLAAYLKLLNSGVGSVEAGERIFGDFRKLESELYDYARRSSMTTIRLPAARLEPGPVTVRELRPGEAAMMPIRIRSRRGVNREQALELLPEARKVAASFPSDPAVLAALAEAEHDAGNYDAGIAAADAALAIDPKLVDAYVQKGYALFAKVKDAPDKAAALKAARASFLALNRIENDHPLPLVYYFLTSATGDKAPDDTSTAALRRAVELAPFDMSLHSMLAIADIRRDDKAEALENLRTIAFNPHHRSMAEWAGMVLDALGKGAGYDQLVKDGLLNRPQEADGPD